jgi:hypothetical protein
MVAESDGKIDMKVLRDENEELMNLFLTNKAKSIPNLLLLKRTVLCTLGSKT